MFYSVLMCTYHLKGIWCDFITVDRNKINKKKKKKTPRATVLKMKPAFTLIFWNHNQRSEIIVKADFNQKLASKSPPATAYKIHQINYFLN